MLKLKKKEKLILALHKLLCSLRKSQSRRTFYELNNGHYQKPNREKSQVKGKIYRSLQIIIIEKMYHLDTCPQTEFNTVLGFSDLVSGYLLFLYYSPYDLEIKRYKSK